jgi:hypothetical protein
LYEAPFNPNEPVICLDEKPVTLHAEGVLLLPPRLAETHEGTSNTGDAVRRLFSAQ